VNIDSSVLVRNTDRAKGRRIWMSPRNRVLKYLTYARIVLEAKSRPVTLFSKTHETSLICMKGEGRVRLDGIDATLRPYDALFIPRGVRCAVETGSHVDFLESSAPTPKDAAPQVVRFDDVKQSKDLTVDLRQPPFSRTIHILIGANVPQATRLLCGVTMGEPGNWTSWPPHEHGKLKEEVYVFFDMPRPAFAVQFLYTKSPDMEFIKPVYEGDAVAIPKGYHPSVACPAAGIRFAWMMAAFRPETDRLLSTMTVQPGFAAAGKAGGLSTTAGDRRQREKTKP
jgi:5-deoxy-glucuronate isomerase